ncbi:MAG: glycosyltransferase [Kaistella sp.]
MPVHISSDLFSGFQISETCQTSVVIPVRNEAESLLSCLQAFGRQVTQKKKPLNPESFEILILANNCTDDSVEIVRRFQCENSFLRIYLAEVHLSNEDANIGFVRRLLMNEAFKRLRNNHFGEGVIMTTDGDTTVAGDWIESNLREFKAGADAVCGRIIINNSELKKMNGFCRRIHLKDEEYRLLVAEIEALIDNLPFDDAPRHHQNFNGSFAVTTHLYEKSGGVPKVKFLEDCAFFDRLQKIDARVRHSPEVKVYTSSRHIGRSEVGLSFQLNQWKKLEGSGADILVESAESIIKRITAQRDLRKMWRRFSDGEKVDLKGLETVSTQVSVMPEFILRELEKKEPFGAFYSELMREQHCIAEWTRKLPLVSLDEAVDNLKTEIQKLKPEIKKVKREINRRRAQYFSQTSMR